MLKKYYKRANTLNVIIIVDGRAFRPIFEDNGHGQYYATDNERIQYAIETSNYFKKSIFCSDCVPFTKEELDKLAKHEEIKKDDAKVANTPISDNTANGSDKGADGTNVVEDESDASESEVEKISGVNSIQKVYAFFDARGIKYSKPLTVARAKEIAKENNIVFVDYK